MANDRYAPGGVCGPEGLPEPRACPLMDAEPRLTPQDEDLCECGHTAYWHADDGSGDCEGSNIIAPGSFAPCECDGFVGARGE